MIAPPELTNLESELSAAYLQISASYKRMSKIRDNYTLNIHQKFIDATLEKTLELRGKIDAVRKAITEAWETEKAKSKPDFNH